MKLIHYISLVSWLHDVFKVFWTIAGYLYFSLILQWWPAFWSKPEMVSKTKKALMFWIQLQLSPNWCHIFWPPFRHWQPPIHHVLFKCYPSFKKYCHLWPLYKIYSKWIAKTWTTTRPPQIGKKHALKNDDQFALNTSCLYGILHICAISRNFLKRHNSEVIHFLYTTKKFVKSEFQNS